MRADEGPRWLPQLGPIMWMGLQGEEPTEPFLALVVGPVHHVGHFESSVYDLL